MAGRDKITPKGKDFFKQIEELRKLQVRVGFQKGEVFDEDSGADLVDIAAWNELGTEYSPPRPFLRQSVENNEATIREMCRLQLEAVVKGKATAKDALQALGVMQKGLIQATIRNGSFAPNAPITVEGGWLRRKGGKAFYVKGKGSNKPLKDTGQMQQSVSFVIKEKGDD